MATKKRPKKVEADIPALVREYKEARTAANIWEDRMEDAHNLLAKAIVETYGNGATVVVGESAITGSFDELRVIYDLDVMDVHVVGGA